MQIQVLHPDTIETNGIGSSVMIQFDGIRNYLFNAPDSLQRICMEHHVRLKRVEQIFLTCVHEYTTSGLPGMILTLEGCQEVNGNNITVHGPEQELKRFLGATKHFMRERVRDLVCQSFTKLNGDVQFQNKGTSIFSLPMMADRNDVSQIGYVNYVVKSGALQGKFLIDKAKALGVPLGPLCGRLKNGNVITLPDGSKVEPHQVVAPSKPGKVCLLAHCPSEEYLQRFSDALLPISSKDIMLAQGEKVDVMVHYTPMSIVQDERYKEILKKVVGFSTVQHIVLHHKDVIAKSPFHASSTLQEKLHALASDYFPPIAPGDKTRATNLPIKNHSLLGLENVCLAVSSNLNF